MQLQLNFLEQVGEIELKRVFLNQEWIPDKVSEILKAVKYIEHFLELMDNT